MTDHHELFMVHQKNAATTDRDWLDEALAGFHAVRDSSVKIDLGLVHRCDAGSCGELRSVLREAIRRHTYSRDEVRKWLIWAAIAREFAVGNDLRPQEVLTRAQNWWCRNRMRDDDIALTIADAILAELDKRKAKG